MHGEAGGLRRVEASVIMTTEDLIAEGRRLQRPCSFLRPTGSGDVAAIWHSTDDSEPDSSGFRPWISIDARFIPGFAPATGRFLTILTNEDDCESGRVDIVPSLPEGKALYAHSASVLPPVDAVFACGSAAVEEWLLANEWTRADRYNDNFADWAIVDGYERLWMEEFPLYLPDTDIYAVLGGWHFPFPDDDWHELMPQQLLAMTIRDSEPWVEAWRLMEGGYRVIQRIT